MGRRAGGNQRAGSTRSAAAQPSLAGNVSVTCSWDPPSLCMLELAGWAPGYPKTRTPRSPAAQVRRRRLLKVRSPLAGVGSAAGVAGGRAGPVSSLLLSFQALPPAPRTSHSLSLDGNFVQRCRQRSRLGPRSLPQTGPKLRRRRGGRSCHFLAPVGRARRFHANCPLVPPHPTPPHPGSHQARLQARVEVRSQAWRRSQGFEMHASSGASKAPLVRTPPNSMPLLAASPGNAQKMRTQSESPR